LALFCLIVEIAEFNAVNEVSSEDVYETVVFMVISLILRLKFVIVDVDIDPILGVDKV